MSYEVVTFLSMNGRGAEAIDFYEKTSMQKLSLRSHMRI